MEGERRMLDEAKMLSAPCFGLAAEGRQTDKTSACVFRKWRNLLLITICGLHNNNYVKIAELFRLFH